jgi:hypothetical protein
MTETIGAILTEDELWKTIEGAGATLSMLYNIDDGDFSEEDKAQIERDISHTSRIQEQAIEFACERFNLIHPKNYPETKPGQPHSPAPEGKTYYHDWYQTTRIGIIVEEAEAITTTTPLQ